MKSGNKKAKQPEQNNGFRYIGDGSAMVDIPARDLSDAEIDDLAVKHEWEPGQFREMLRHSGLYATDADLERIAAAGQAGAAAGEQLKNALLQEDGDGTRTEGTS